MQALSFLIWTAVPVTLFAFAAVWWVFGFVFVGERENSRARLIFRAATVCLACGVSCFALERFLFTDPEVISPWSGWLPIVRLLSFPVLVLIFLFCRMLKHFMSPFESTRFKVQVRNTGAVWAIIILASAGLWYSWNRTIMGRIAPWSSYQAFYGQESSDFKKNVGAAGDESKLSRLERLDLVIRRLARKVSEESN